VRPNARSVSLSLSVFLLKVADYSAQAVINTILSQAFPEDPIVGEEDASDLRAPTEASQALRARVVELADDILAQPPTPTPTSSSSLPPSLGADSDFDIGGGGERAEWGLGRRWGVDALLKAIDRGSYSGGRSGRACGFSFVLSFCSVYAHTWAFHTRSSYTGMWTLDPIDGTKGFLRGGQYAVCLALLVDARVELGVIGCPNLPSAASPSPPSTSTSSSTAAPDDASINPRGTGALFITVRGHGVHQLPLLVPPPPSTPAVHQRRLNMPRLAIHELSFLESVEKAHAALDTNVRIAERLGVRAEPTRMDSQAKYAALVRGDSGGGVYLRLPVAGGGRGGGAGGYEEKIWVRYEHLILNLPDWCSSLFFFVLV
jgi:3'-phosphoadenosine 5'-phosphosulfate (PAPS) 3'-phosphatase